MQNTTWLHMLHEVPFKHLQFTLHRKALNAISMQSAQGLFLNNCTTRVGISVSADIAHTGNTDISVSVIILADTY